MKKTNSYAEQKKQKLKASKSLADTIHQHHQQINFMRGGFLALSGLVGVLLEQEKGPLSEELETQKQVLLQQVAGYQSLITGADVEG